MDKIVRKDFCTACRKATEYILRKEQVKKVIKDKEYSFTITNAVCKECGNDMPLPGLIDKNIQEIDGQYRDCEGLVSITDIQKLMEMYKIGKGPLSLALGFGEITITRYLNGQIPSKEYSDIVKKALTSPDYMLARLKENRDKLAPAAYKKAVEAAEQLENLFTVSEKMVRVIAYIFHSLDEVTPLILQKLLYFIQGMSYAQQGKPMFTEDCQAWIHGPVYQEVYELFRDFKFNPLDDARFAIFSGNGRGLSSADRRIIDLVMHTFGEYGGKALERITYVEQPWVEARRGYGEGVPANAMISKESIATYYVQQNNIYDFSTEKGIRKYISETGRIGSDS